MKTCIPLKRAIQSIILFFMLVAIVIVWPLRIIRPMYQQGAINEGSTALVQNEGTIVQGFAAQRPDLAYISFYIYNEDISNMENGRLIYRFYNETMTKLDEKEISLDELTVPGLCQIKFRGEVEQGKNYYISLENPDAELVYSMSDGINLDVMLEYRSYFAKWQYALYGLAVFLIGGLLLLVSEKVIPDTDKKVRTDWGVRVGSSVILTGVSLWAAINVFPLCKFTTDLINILFYETGIFLFLGFGLYALLHRRNVEEREIQWSFLVSKIPQVLQVLALSGVMTGCVRHVNALYNFQQWTANHTTLIWFAIAIILGFSRKEILNWYNLVYLVISVAGGIWYCLQNNGDAESLTLAEGKATIVVLWGIILLNVIRMLIEKRRTKVCLVYTIALVLLFAEMIRSRNTRTWPIVIVVFFGLFALRVVLAKETTEFMNHFVDGVFVNYIGVCIYSVLYRPFHYFYYTRYSSVFHTATVAAVYNCFVLALVSTRLLTVYYNKGSLKAAWKELGMFAVCSAFAVLTISRTASLMVVAIVAFSLIITLIFLYKDGILGLLKRFGVIMISSVIGFVVVFTACRIGPAVVSKPYTYDREWFAGSIYAGEEWDSRWFITVQRFFEVTVDRMGISFGVSAEAAQENADTTSEQAAQTESTTETGTAEVSTTGGETRELTEVIEEYSNGRTDIFRDYLSALNWKGHDTMQLLDENGNEIQYHAHNSFIQTAHDFGIGEGIFFLVFCVGAGIYSIYYYAKRKQDKYGLVPTMIILTFGISAMVERVFFPYIPLGFAFLLVLVVLIPRIEEGSQKDRLKQDEKNV